MDKTKVWKNHELAFLVAHCSDMTAKEISAEINRTERAVRIKASALGLRLKLSDYQQEFIKANQSHAIWTNADEVLLRGTYDYLPLKTIARRIGKTEEYMEQKVKELGLVKKPHVRPKTETMPVPKCYEKIIFCGNS